MAVLILLVVLLGQILNNASNAWSFGEANKERMQNARAISEFIANDLGTALLPINRTSVTSLQLVVNPAGITPETFNNRDAIFWQAPVATDQTLGDVAEIGYFVKWDSSVPTNPRSHLFRFFVNPSKGATPDPSYEISTAPNAWLSDAIIQTVAPGDNVNGHAYKGLFAENVLGLWVQCFDSAGKQITTGADGSPMTKDAKGNTFNPGGPYGFDSRRGYMDSIQGKKSACALPSAVDISLVLLDARLATKIGPTQQARIIALATTSANAEAFVTSALADPSLRVIIAGLRPHKARVYLQNSR